MDWEREERKLTGQMVCVSVIMGMTRALRFKRCPDVFISVSACRLPDHHSFPINITFVLVASLGQILATERQRDGGRQTR